VKEGEHHLDPMQSVGKRVVVRKKEGLERRRTGLKANVKCTEAYGRQLRAIIERKEQVVP